MNVIDAIPTVAQLRVTPLEQAQRPVVKSIAFGKKGDTSWLGTSFHSSFGSDSESQTFY